MSNSDRRSLLHQFWSVLEGDCRARLAELEPASVQTCVTSPPYFGLRDYGHDGQIGLEPTSDEFVAALVDVFRAVRRVLRDDGTVWLNLGDSYADNANSRSADGNRSFRSDRAAVAPPKRGLPSGMKPKDLVGIPWMVAFALRADGWYLRSDIIWAKPNPMPESVTDRPTKAHEYLFLLSKSARYFYDADAIREEGESFGRQGSERAEEHRTPRGIDSRLHRGPADRYDVPGRNKRSVWSVATQPFPGAHFATFPPKLIEPCILAGSSEKTCGECGAPWTRVVERTKMVVKPTQKRTEWQATDDHARTQTGGTMVEPPTSRTVGWEPSCGHDAGTAPGVVLDPFAGAGTTGVVCGWHGRAFIGCELNPEYAALARDRIALEGRRGGRPASHEVTPVTDGQMDIFGEKAA